MLTLVLATTFENIFLCDIVSGDGNLKCLTFAVLNYTTLCS